MRQICKDIVKTVIDHTMPVRIEQLKVLEIGSNWGDQGEWVDLRPLFPNPNYYGIDIEDGPGVDRVMNVYDLSYFRGWADYVLCIDTLEHIEYPRKAVREMYGSLKSNGILILVTVFQWPIHMHPDDFWRFTPSAMDSLCSDFLFTKCGQIGNSNSPKTVWSMASQMPVMPVDGYSRLETALKSLNEYE